MKPLDNFNLNKDLYDCNIWYGIHNLNSELNVGKEMLSGYMGDLREKFKKPVLLLSNFYSLFYDPIEGDSELEEIISDKRQSYLGALVFPGYYISRRKDFKKYFENRYRSGFRLLRLFPKTHRYSIDLWAFKEFYEILNFHRFPVMINIEELDVTGNKEIDWSLIYKITIKYPDIPVIIDGGNSKEMIFTGYISQILQNTENVYLDIHNLFAFDQIEKIIAEFGSNRLIFDSYFPFYEEGMVLTRVEMARISEAEKADIFSGNMKRFINEIYVHR